MTTIKNDKIHNAVGYNTAAPAKNGKLCFRELIIQVGTRTSLGLITIYFNMKTGVRIFTTLVLPNIQNIFQCLTSILQVFSCLPNIKISVNIDQLVTVTKLRKGWAGNVVHTGEVRNVYNFFDGET
jgi:hypothetical protein